MGKNRKTATSQNLMVDANGYLINDNHNEFDPNSSFENNYQSNYTQNTLDINDINTNMPEDAVFLFFPICTTLILKLLNIIF